MKNDILIVVDMQNDFIDGALGSADAEEIVNSVIREIESNYFSEIFITKDVHYNDYLNTHEGKNLPIKHCLNNTIGCDINEKVMRSIINSKLNYRIFEKNGFGCISLIEHLKSTSIIFDSITLVGLCTDICLISNALLLRSYFPNTPMYYVEDATAATTEENKKAALQILNACQIYNREKSNG